MKKYIVVFKNADFGIYKIGRLLMFDSYAEAMDYMKEEILLGNCLNRIEDYTAISLVDQKMYVEKTGER